MQLLQSARTNIMGAGVLYSYPLRGNEVVLTGHCACEVRRRGGKLACSRGPAAEMVRFRGEASPFRYTYGGL